MSQIIRVLHRLEDGILVLLLLSMIVLAGVDILARLLFGGGLVWVTPLLRVMVLWVGLAGALVATRTREHIAIDLVSRLAPPAFSRFINVVTLAFAATVCVLIAWHSTIFVNMTREFDDRAFSDLPAWILQAIIPVSFGLMGLRFALQSLMALMGKLPEDVEEKTEHVGAEQ
ncbi:MAG: C4-dicarboxylate ABC transporter permease [Oceanospirillaceae bacterium]|nr:C4-dicarboxylate ABC transporter permease [Oceanospirillaceae bacterium]|tara:strand:- start:711 stop:1226 length:516 start_codon:yes stop_codon:yes gene_type:complete